MLVFVFSGLVALLDQFFKQWIVRTVDVATPAYVDQMDLIPGVIDLIHVHNTGAAFNILAGQRWLLAGIAFVACIVLVFILLRYTEGFWGTLGLAAVLGGAVGNLIDRVIHGYVIDMFRTLFVNFAIFNIADIFITLGFLTFCIHFIAVTIRQAREEKEGLDEEALIDGGEFSEDYDDYYDEEHGEHYQQNEEIDYAEEFNRGHAPEGHGHVQQSYQQPAQVGPGMDTDPDLSELREYIEDSQSQSAHVSSAYAEPVVTQEHSVKASGAGASSWHGYYDNTPDSAAGGDSSTSEALSALELELNSVDDYDIDSMLKEYGFEIGGSEQK
ncbi:MAG: signal peptidase II [Oscillospiraceae bacterium]|nr:signal peptidase II [Oscillospiraceae bacterium]